MFGNYTIDFCTFGKIVVNGTTYTDDLIIYEDHIQDSWRRAKGHFLRIDDIPLVVEKRPEVLVVGTGASGMMEVPRDTKSRLLAMEIEIVAAPTNRAVKYFNRLKSKKRTIGAFHLSC